MLGGCAHADPLIPKTGADTAVDHGLQHLVRGLIAHAMQQVTLSAQLLQSKQIAAFMVDAGQARVDELPGDVSQPVAVALRSLLWGEGLPLAYLVEHASRPVGDPTVQFTAGVVIEGSPWPVGRAPGDLRQRERFAVVIRRVAAAMVDHHRVITRDVVEVVNIKLAIIFYLRVIKEISIYPEARRRFFSFCTELVNDTGDGDEFDRVRIADQDLVQQGVAGSMIVAINESGHDCHLLRIEGYSPFPDETPGFCTAADSYEAAAPDGEGFDPGILGIHGVNLGVEDNQVGDTRVGTGGLSAGAGRGPQEFLSSNSRNAYSGQAQEFSTAVVLFHSLSSRGHSKALWQVAENENANDH